jgi:hypothetical protein
VKEVAFSEVFSKDTAQGAVPPLPLTMLKLATGSAGLQETAITTIAIQINITLFIFNTFLIITVR